MVQKDGLKGGIIRHSDFNRKVINNPTLNSEHVWNTINYFQTIIIPSMSFMGVPLTIEESNSIRLLSCNSNCTFRIKINNNLYVIKLLIYHDIIYETPKMLKSLDKKKDPVYKEYINKLFKETNNIIQIGEHKNFAKYYGKFYVDTNERYIADGKISIDNKKVDYLTKYYITIPNKILDDDVQYEHFKKYFLDIPYGIFGYIIEHIDYSITYIATKIEQQFDKELYLHYFIPKILRDYMEGLRRIHQRGYIHGDIKPDNLMIKKYENNYVGKIIDMDICSMQNIPRCSYTDKWASPEILVDKLFNPKSDVYSCAISILYMIYMSYPEIKGTCNFFDLIKQDREDYEYSKNNKEKKYDSIQKWNNFLTFYYGKNMHIKNIFIECINYDILARNTTDLVIDKCNKLLLQNAHMKDLINNIAIPKEQEYTTEHAIIGNQDSSSTIISEINFDQDYQDDNNDNNSDNNDSSYFSYKYKKYKYKYKSISKK